MDGDTPRHDGRHRRRRSARPCPGTGSSPPPSTFVDEHGLTALTMRRLGKELGVEAMSLYRYVNGREDLLEGMVDRMVAELHLRLGRRLLAADRRLAGLPAVAGPRRPVARPRPPEGLPADRDPAPRRAVAAAAAAQPAGRRGLPLHARSRAGFSDARAVEAYRAFSSFLLGHLLLEASLLGAQTGPAEEPLDEGDSDVPNADQELDLEEFPHIQRLEGQLSEDHAGPEFERALEDLLDRLDREITE